MKLLYKVSLNDLGVLNVVHGMCRLDVCKMKVTKKKKEVFFISSRKRCSPMGSVLALSSGPGQQNWPFSTDPPSSRWDAHPAHWYSPPRWERRDGRLPNPGSFHSLHRSCKGLPEIQFQRPKRFTFLNRTNAFIGSNKYSLSLTELY